MAPTGPYWVNVLTKEMTDNKPMEFQVEASRDATGQTRDEALTNPCCVYLRRRGEGSQIWGTMGTRCGIAVMGRVGISLQLSGVICPCSKGWDGV